jgi:two-component system, NtrC family, response regulator AtoC
MVCGLSPIIQRLNAIVAQISQVNIPVLLVGESGTGKEVYAHWIHTLSRHSHGPLQKLSCRALEPDQFVAQAGPCLKRVATSQEARTVYLDGVDELDFTCQKVLLSMLPDGEGHQNGNSGLRLIASASRNLDTEIKLGRFRRELYFRINGVCLRLPPLKERREDIVPLVEHFLANHAGELQRTTPVLGSSVIDVLVKYDWPGNIRELKNFAREVVVLGDVSKPLDELRTLPAPEPELMADQRTFSLKVAAKAASRQAERDLISQALQRTRWNRKRAARDLQISYKSLLYKIKQTGLDGKQKETLVKEQ